MKETWRQVPTGAGIKLSVREVAPERPEEPPLLLLHGLASCQHIWDLMLPRLARRRKVVTYDARGHGLSSKPSFGYGFEQVSADAAAVIDATGLSRPVVAGHSWGAMVALDLAARRPRKVSGLVMVDGGVFRMRDNFRSWKEAREKLAPPHLAGMPVEQFRGLIRTFFSEAVEVTPDVERIVLALMHVRKDGTIRPRLSRANHFRILRAIWDHDPIDLHERLRVPSLAILAHMPDADEDERSYLEAKRRAAERIRSSRSPTRIAWVEGIHDLPLQHPEMLAGRIERFIRSLLVP